MNNIENTYIKYDELITLVGHEVIESRIQQVSQEMLDFLTFNKLNEIKIKAYETFWLLKRKPLQLKGQVENDKFLYVNEKFLLTRLTSFMLGDDINKPIVGENSTMFKNFLDTLYYYLKFRKCDAQSMELMLLAFKAGQLVS
ncbi:MAG: hypothetical protein HFH19_12150 [Ruminococcus sp.]|nr:hypothetical protein [Ruminococcus sp.]